MFKINQDASIFLTRGDIANIVVNVNDSGGEPYRFAKGDIVRFMVFEKNACNCVVLCKSVEVTEETTSVEIYLTGSETRIGEAINKPKDYWYEVELNPDTQPQTIIGYDEDGAKIFRLFPEGVQENG